MPTERLEPLYYYKWLWKDWRSNRRVKKMHYIAKGLYRELLDEQFVEGFIPNDIDELAAICECPRAVMQEYWPEIQPHFEDDGQGGLVNPKMESVRTDTDTVRVKASRAGKASAEAKALKRRQESTGVQRSLPSVDVVQPVRDRVRDREELEQPVVSVEEPPIDACMAGRALSERVGNMSIRFQEMCSRMVAFEASKRHIPLEDIVDVMAGQWTAYNLARDNLNYPVSKVQTFFESGTWHDSALWPWKDGKSPTPKTSNRYWKPGDPQ